MNALVPERSKDTKDKLNENLQTVVVELAKLIKQSNKNSGSNEVGTAQGYPQFTLIESWMFNNNSCLLMCSFPSDAAKERQDLD